MPFECSAAMRIREITGGGADLVLECVGSAATVAAAVRALLPGGRLIAVGVGMMPATIDLPQAIFSLAELAVIGGRRATVTRRSTGRSG